MEGEVLAAGDRAWRGPGKARMGCGKVIGPGLGCTASIGTRPVPTIGYIPGSVQRICWKSSMMIRINKRNKEYKTIRSCYLGPRIRMGLEDGRKLMRWRYLGRKRHQQ